VGEEGYSKDAARGSCPGSARSGQVRNKAERYRTWEVLGRTMVMPMTAVSTSRGSGVVFASNIMIHHFPLTERSFVEAFDLAGLGPIEVRLDSAGSLL
jgi:hypothetical protein